MKDSRNFAIHLLFSLLEILCPTASNRITHGEHVSHVQIGPQDLEAVSNFIECYKRLDDEKTSKRNSFIGRSDSTISCNTFRAKTRMI